MAGGHSALVSVFWSWTLVFLGQLPYGRCNAAQTVGSAPYCHSTMRKGWGIRTAVDQQVFIPTIVADATNSDNKFGSDYGLGDLCEALRRDPAGNLTLVGFFEKFVHF